MFKHSCIKVFLFLFSLENTPRLLILMASSHLVVTDVSLSLFPSGESEPGDRQRVSSGGRHGDHQLSGEEQRRLCDTAAQPQQADDLLPRPEAWVLCCTTYFCQWSSLTCPMKYFLLTVWGTLSTKNTFQEPELLSWFTQWKYHKVVLDTKKNIMMNPLNICRG